MGDPPQDTISVWTTVYKTELGWIADVDEKFVCDDFHNGCVHLLAYLDGEPVGTARVVFPCNGYLPCEGKANDKTVLRDCKNKAEITRVMVIDRFRKMTFPCYPNGIYDALMQRAITVCQSNLVELVAMDVRIQSSKNSIFRSLKKFGFLPTGISYPDPLGVHFPDCTTVILDTKSKVRQPV
ncbi:hypothetical protein [Yoonia sp. BS5-3]|uniref:N-acetyltransferase domain-containing protein n=1 Tax=Yoonia phaeophyticola TaxID=3137369 RepID=A0ABZ2V3I7_9RHOB